MNWGFFLLFLIPFGEVQKSEAKPIVGTRLKFQQEGMINVFTLLSSEVRQPVVNWN